MANKKKAGKYWRTDDLVELWDRGNRGETFSSIAKNMDRSQPGVRGCFYTLKGIMENKPWAMHKLKNDDWNRAITIIRKGETEVPPVSNNQSYSNVTVERMQDELADNLDGFRKYLIDWTIGIVNVLDQDRQALLH